MATRYVTKMICDSCGREGTQEDTGAQSFAFGNMQYELDLCTPDREAFEADMQKWVTSARRIGRVTTATSSTGAARSASNISRASNHGYTDRQQNQAIRDWAKRKNLNLADRGRIPAAIMEAYEQDMAPSHVAGRAHQTNSAALAAIRGEKPAKTEPVAFTEPASKAAKTVDPDVEDDARPLSTKERSAAVRAARASGKGSKAARTIRTRGIASRGR